MQSSRALDPILYNTHFSTMLKVLNKRIKRLFTHLRWPLRWPLRCRLKSKIVIKVYAKPKTDRHRDNIDDAIVNGPSKAHQDGELSSLNSVKPIRVATFNAAMFSMAPAMPRARKSSSFDYENEGITKSDRPKSILKQSPLHRPSMKEKGNLSKQQKFVKSKLRVSINLPDNEISLLRSRQLSFSEHEKEGCSSMGTTRLRSTMSFSGNWVDGCEEEKAMMPLSDLAIALGMNYVFTESWAPEYGNAVLSKWPIKRWKVQKIFDDTDFRNVLKATIDVPQTGEIGFHFTHLDHLDENWRMKQISAIIQSNDGPHILAGGLNSLEGTDYSTERLTDIVKVTFMAMGVLRGMGKPTPKVEVMKYLKTKQYTDAKDFAGECVQGTCKYGTRVDYILASPDSPYKFVLGSYSVLSSKGTSDHHIVKVDIGKENEHAKENGSRKRRKQTKPKQKVVKISDSSSLKSIWKTHS
ncbi:GH3 family protein [Hibiscus syriacus]|uniref:GH3 family protein n=1 Tax=Hibiscus syriacus TaxID=106335 RepID=A0A6A3AV20_HIBSY|nr:GH3 family protein [Hibiscus syriacus]